MIIADISFSRVDYSFCACNTDETRLADTFGRGRRADVCLHTEIGNSAFLNIV